MDNRTNDTFSLTCGKHVFIGYNSKEFDRAGTTRGFIENVGGGKVYIKSDKDCLEVFNFKDIELMIETKQKRSKL